MNFEKEVHNYIEKNAAIGKEVFSRFSLLAKKFSIETENIAGINKENAFNMFLQKTAVAVQERCVANGYNFDIDVEPTGRAYGRFDETSFVETVRWRFSANGTDIFDIKMTIVYSEHDKKAGIYSIHFGKLNESSNEISNRMNFIKQHSDSLFVEDLNASLMRKARNITMAFYEIRDYITEIMYETSGGFFANLLELQHLNIEMNNKIKEMQLNFRSLMVNEFEDFMSLIINNSMFDYIKITKGSDGSRHRRRWNYRDSTILEYNKYKQNKVDFKKTRDSLLIRTHQETLTGKTKVKSKRFVSVSAIENMTTTFGTEFTFRLNLLSKNCGKFANKIKDNTPNLSTLMSDEHEPVFSFYGLGDDSKQNHSATFEYFLTIYDAHRIFGEFLKVALIDFEPNTFMKKTVRKINASKTHKKKKNV